MKARLAKGASMSPNEVWCITPSVTVTSTIAMTAMITVPSINATGSTFSGFFVSSERNVIDSIPKKVCPTKKTFYINF